MLFNQSVFDIYISLSLFSVSTYFNVFSLGVRGVCFKLASLFAYMHFFNELYFNLLVTYCWVYLFVLLSVVAKYFISMSSD